jgi:hypothetical protein
MDLTEELAKTQLWAGTNPKNFQLWQHRRALCAEVGPKAAEGELAFTASVFREDPKNYHAWSHRRWVISTLVVAPVRGLETAAALYGRLEAEELTFLEALIAADVRNNSAWTHRWFVLSLLSPGVPCSEAAVSSGEGLAWREEERVREEMTWAIDWMHSSGVFANESALNHLRCVATALRTRQVLEPSFPIDSVLAPLVEFVGELEGEVRRALAHDDEAKSPPVIAIVAGFVADWHEEAFIHAQRVGSELPCTEAMRALEEAATLDPIRAHSWRMRARLLGS